MSTLKDYDQLFHYKFYRKNVWQVVNCYASESSAVRCTITIFKVFVR